MYEDGDNADYNNLLYMILGLAIYVKKLENETKTSPPDNNDYKKGESENERENKGSQPQQR